MGLLRHLWDDTIAGPPPESRLSDLYKFHDSSSSAAAGNDSATAVAGGVGRLQITRSITILRPSVSPTSSAASSPRCSSPAACVDASLSPPTPRSHWTSLRRKATAAPAAEGMESVEPRSPTVYDWMVISSLDR